MFVLPRFRLPPYLWHRGVLMEIPKDPNEIVDVISLANMGFGKTLDAEYRIRVKINGKYYVGHLEMSE